MGYAKRDDYLSYQRKYYQAHRAILLARAKERRPLHDPNHKRCEVCGDVFARVKGTRPSHWALRRCCSRRCRAIAANRIAMQHHYERWAPIYAARVQQWKPCRVCGKRIQRRATWGDMEWCMRSCCGKACQIANYSRIIWGHRRLMERVGYEPRRRMTA